jgi:hypothetical protein
MLMTNWKLSLVDFLSSELSDPIIGGDLAILGGVGKYVGISGDINSVDDNFVNGTVDGIIITCN